MLLEDASVVFVTVIGMVGGIAAWRWRTVRDIAESWAAAQTTTSGHPAPWSTVPNEPQPVVPLRSDRARCRAD
jgi:hypothetical protein